MHKNEAINFQLGIVEFVGWCFELCSVLVHQISSYLMLPSFVLASKQQGQSPFTGRHGAVLKYHLGAVKLVDWIANL